MKKFTAILLLAAIMILPSGCVKTAPSEPQEPDNSVKFSFTKENMPKIDGSTATIPLAEAVYSVLLGVPRAEAAGMVEFSGTNSAYKELADKNADILFVYEKPGDAQQYIDEKGVELEFAAIGKDALVFLVNSKNSVKNLSAEQIVGIYEGKITSWKDVGGAKSLIKAFQRNETSGSQTLMKKLVMNGKELMKAPEEWVAGEMGELIDYVAAYENSASAIGYNVYYYVSKMKSDPNISMLSVNGILPEKASIENGSYPFVNDFYAVIRKDAKEGSPERILFDWIQSAAGQSLIDGEGYAKAK